MNTKQSTIGGAIILGSAAAARRVKQEVSSRRAGEGVSNAQVAREAILQGLGGATVGALAGATVGVTANRAGGWLAPEREFNFRWEGIPSETVKVRAAGGQEAAKRKVLKKLKDMHPDAVVLDRPTGILLVKRSVRQTRVMNRLEELIGEFMSGAGLASGAQTDPARKRIIGEVGQLVKSDEFITRPSRDITRALNGIIRKHLGEGPA